MEYKATKSFWEDYKNLPPELKEKAKKNFELFKQNQRHPSLQTHHIKGTSNPKVYEGYLDKGYRFTFHYEEGSVVFRRIGSHGIIDEEARS